MQVKSKEATAIINSLVGGVVPKLGIQHITVGRKKEVNAMIKALEEVEDDHSIVKFWIGEFGSGKSFMLHLLNTIAIKKKFVVSNADFTPEKRLYSNDRKAVALYSTIIDNLSIQTKPEGGALEILLEKWIENVLMTTAEEANLSFDELREEKNVSLVENKIMKTTNDLTDVGGFNFGTVMMKYYKGFIDDDTQLKRNAIRWLKGEYTTKTEARQDLGVREIINDLNCYDMLKNFSRFFKSIGYKGFMINLDEAINLYKIPNRQMREKNYEKILTIYNDCFQGNTKNLFFNFAGTEDFLENERRGLFSYNALKTRLESNQFETESVRDFSQPVIKLRPLNDSEIFVLLKKLKSIFDINYSVEIDFSDDNIKQYMEHKLNQQGAAEFLTPREVIRYFLNMLNILRQNPSHDKEELLKSFTKKSGDEIDLSEISIDEI